MTDNEIIKALECCGFDEDICLDCPIQCDCEKDTESMIGRAKAILDLINRLKAQNKEFDEKIVMQMGLIEHQRDEIVALTEIIEKGDFTSYSACRAIEDRKRKNAEYINELKAEIERYKGVIKLLEKDVLTAKTEAIKEFVGRLKETMDVMYERVDGYRRYQTEDYFIDSLVEEMTE